MSSRKRGNQILELKRVIEDSEANKKSKEREIQALDTEKDYLKNQLNEQKRKNAKFTTPIATQVHERM